jgi:hypothetical protein
MNVIVSKYIDVIKNVKEETTPIVNNGGSRKAIFKTFCLDITKLESKGVLNTLQVSSILSNINSQIDIINGGFNYSQTDINRKLKKEI